MSQMMNQKSVPLHNMKKCLNDQLEITSIVKTNIL